jgi:hypothetical protein
MWPFGISKKKRQEQKKKNQLYMMLYAVGGALISAGIIIPVILTQCKPKAPFEEKDIPNDVEFYKYDPFDHSVLG